jgi:hypothetical protein
MRPGVVTVLWILVTAIIVTVLASLGLWDMELTETQYKLVGLGVVVITIMVVLACWSILQYEYAWSDATQLG